MRMRSERKETAMKQYMVDAFTDRVFSGNPAAVCVIATVSLYASP